MFSNLLIVDAGGGDYSKSRSAFATDWRAYYQKLSMLPLNLVATLPVTGLINTSTGYSCYLINKEKPQFMI